MTDSGKWVRWPGSVIFLEETTRPRFSWITFAIDNIYVTINRMIVIEELEQEDGSHPFQRWFTSLNVPAALKVRTAIARMEMGNFSNTKSVGQGVSESKIDFGPGYRIYFGKDGDTLVILLGGGTKKRQSLDIKKAKEHWKDYKIRKRRG
jgi:putative addiction module killer protein